MERRVKRGDYTILVVDDNAANRYAIARSLRALGFRTLEASSGTEGLALSGMSAAVVLDVNLPDIHGFEVCRTLRASATTDALPIVHISASSVSDADQRRGRSEGADAYMVDPVDPFVLAFTLDELLQRLDAEPGDRTGTGAKSVRQQMTNTERNRKED
jgi:CheY-like chemotaxis protein